MNCCGLSAESMDNGFGTRVSLLTTSLVYTWNPSPSSRGRLLPLLLSYYLPVGKRQRRLAGLLVASFQMI